MNNYKSAYGRAFVCVVKKFYGTFSEFGRQMGFSSQYALQIPDTKCSIPLASYLGRTHNVPPAIFCYPDALLLTPEIKSFEHLVRTCETFTSEMKKYILAGDFIKDRDAFFSKLDK